MLIICFFGLAIVIVLIAAPWRAPSSTTTISHSYLIVSAALIEVLVLRKQEFTFGPLLGTFFIGLWASQNTSLPGIWLLLLGVGANGLAMLSNGGAMPLHPEAAQVLGISETAHTLLQGSKDTIAHAGSLLWLTDWLMLRSKLMTLVLSPGDLLICTAFVRWS